MLGSLLVAGKGAADLEMDNETAAVRSAAKEVWREVKKNSVVTVLDTYRKLFERAIKKPQQRSSKPNPNREPKPKSQPKPKAAGAQQQPTRRVTRSRKKRP